MGIYCCAALALLVIIKMLIMRSAGGTVRTAALRHAASMDNLLYPPLSSDNSVSTLKARKHAVRMHPIYNFLHTYYRYSAEELKLYTPGVGAGVQLENAQDLALMHPTFRRVHERCVSYSLDGPLPADGRYGWIQLSRVRDILRNTEENPPSLGCFGLHEWAMLYRGNPPHQTGLSLRVSQHTIDAVVETEGNMKCTHYDAYRFFHPDAKPLNSLPRLSREVQPQHEQPACIHASMDLFKFAYKLYPLCSAELLHATLAAALKARKIDMRASPYDVSAYEGCEEAIRVETPEGKKSYIHEQIQLMKESAPLRSQLREAYEAVLSV